MYQYQITQLVRLEKLPPMYSRYLLVALTLISYSNIPNVERSRYVFKKMFGNLFAVATTYCCRRIPIGHLIYLIIRDSSCKWCVEEMSLFKPVCHKARQSSGCHDKKSKTARRDPSFVITVNTFEGERKWPNMIKTFECKQLYSCVWLTEWAT